MYIYTDYFDEEKKKLPYADAAEEMEDGFLLLDMILEAFLREKGERCFEDSWHVRGSRVSEEEIQDYFALPPGKRPGDRYSEETAEDALEALEFMESREAAAEEKGVFLPLSAARRELSLCMAELITLLIALSVQRDLKYLRIYHFIQDDYSLKFPTAGVADAVARFVCRPEEIPCDLVSDRGKLFTWLLDCRGDAELKRYPPFLEPLLLSETAADFFFGRDGIPVSRGAGQEPGKGPRKPLVLWKEELEPENLFTDFLELLDGDPLSKGSARFRYIESRDPEDVIFALSLFARERKLPLFVLNARELGEGENEINAALFYLRMHPGVILIRETGDPGKAEQDQQAIPVGEGIPRLLPIMRDRLSNRNIYLCGERKLPTLEVEPEAMPAVLSLPLPEVRERIRIWQYFLAVEGVLLEDTVDILDVADCHELSFSAIRRIMRQARETMDARGDRLLKRELLQELLFRLNTAHFDYLATAVRAHYTWDDIFLGTAEKQRLKAACSRFRLRNRVGVEWGITKKNAYGNAVIILMYGPPGTGKTMAAQAIANEVMTPLYRVDVSQIFSKYIGETQKNLSRIFDEAEKRSVVLFFDEADALFTKRTEIKDSHDKYANSDTSFLLQKVEEYSGISILATNSYQSFDNAFMRRLTYVVHFERPDEETREKMWRTMLPKEVPMEPDIDYPFLAKSFTELTGSNIKAILLTAAYFAGSSRRAVSMRDIILATRYEFEKLGRLINSEEFGKYALFLQEG